MIAIDSGPCQQHYDGALPGVVCSSANRRRCFPLDDVFRRIQCRIDPPVPPLTAVVQGWQVEFEGLPIGIQNPMEPELFHPDLPAERQAVGPLAPVWLIE